MTANKREFKFGKQEGMQIGEQRGMQIARQEAQAEKLSIARELLNSGVDRKVVLAATHLTEEQLKTLN